MPSFSNFHLQPETRKKYEEVSRVDVHLVYEYQKLERKLYKLFEETLLTNLLEYMTWLFN